MLTNIVAEYTRCLFPGICDVELISHILGRICRRAGMVLTHILSIKTLMYEGCRVQLENN